MSEVRLVCFWRTLVILARDMARARVCGTPEEAAEAEAKWRAYEALCLRADQIL